MSGTLCYHKKAEMKKIPIILTILNATFYLLLIVQMILIQYCAVKVT